MAADLNTVALVGRLTRDPELRHGASGTAIANLRVAFSTRSKDEGGTWGDKSNYVNVVVFGQQAENVVQYLSKGRRVGVQGRLSFSEWTAQDGTKRSDLEIVANDVQYLDSNPSAANGSTPADDLAPVGADSKGPDDTDVPF